MASRGTIPSMIGAQHNSKRPSSARVAPQRMSTRSMFGEQPNSKRPSSASYGFGSATRDQAARVYASKQMAKLSVPSSSPGPAVYNLRSSVGKQAEGHKPSSQQWQFGTDNRFASVALVDKKNPGPGAYSSDASVGIQVRSAPQRIGAARSPAPSSADCTCVIAPSDVPIC